MVSIPSIESDYFPSVSIGAGKIRFGGAERISEVFYETFWVQLPGRPIMYGVWEPQWQNGYDFDAMINIFGFLHFVGPEFLESRAEFGGEETVLVSDLVRALFSNTEARRKHHIFSPSLSARFLGNVHFRAGWIKTIQSGSRAQKTEPKAV